MKNLLNPKWIFLINTLPVLLLFIIFYSQYTVAETLLTSRSKQLWLTFAISLCIISLSSAAYAIWCTIQKTTITWKYAVCSLLVNTAFLYMYAQYSDLIIPFAIPQWILSTEIVIYPGTFLMPTLAYALFLLVVISIPKNSRINPWLNFLYSLLFPLGGYLFTLVVLPFWHELPYTFGTHVLIILLIASTVLFLFFLSRGIYVLTSTYGERLKGYAFIWKIVIALLLPVIGLMVNNGIFKGLHESSPFGNFSHHWFYIIAVINGITVCLPPLENHYHRLIRFFVQMACFPFTLYFFLVFLPYLPLAIIAIIAIGIGFLMLAPLGLFILQVNDLYSEYIFFLKSYSAKKLVLGLAFAFSLIPSLITISYLHKRIILTDALEYVYDRQPDKIYSISPSSLKNILTVLKGYKSHHSLDSSMGNIPYLNSYYKWLVLDNLVLSESKIQDLERIFLGETQINSSLAPTLSARVNTEEKIKISKTFIESNYDKKQEAWVSTVNFELKNNATNNFAEYETTFELPVGCWISNYYLFVGKKKEFGILAEKKAALWVFSQIRNENRDPGIVYYQSDNKISFKVFPFAKNETRKSGIEFVHKEPVTLSIDGHQLALGNAKQGGKSTISTVSNAVYIPKNEKTKLTLVQRQPEYHFVIDVSKGKMKNVRSYTHRIENYIRTNNIRPATVKLHFTSAQCKEIKYKPNWQQRFEDQEFENGFYLEGAFKHILLNNYKKTAASYPILLVLTDSLKNAIMINNLISLKDCYPEGPQFYELDFNGKIWQHHYFEDPLERKGALNKIALQIPVYAWPNAKRPLAYLPNDSLASIVLNRQNPKPKIKLQRGAWATALSLHGNIMEVELGLIHQQDNYLQLVKKSMEGHILSPVTSFLVVENEAQKRALMRKQAQILSGNKNLDPDEDTQSMDEPKLYILLIILSFLLLLKLRYKLWAFFKSKVQSQQQAR